MALPPLVDPEDLAEWLERPVASLGPRAWAVVSAASSVVRSYASRTWITNGALDVVPDDVKTVTVQLAARTFNNPDGYSTERLGDYSYGLPASAVTGLALTSAEKAILGRYRSSGSGLWSLSTTREDPAADTAWVPVVGAPPFPWYSDAP